jgi:hypothetical protein
MSRFAVLALLIACGNGSKSASDQQKTPEKTGAEEKIAVPGSKGAMTGAAEGAAVGAASADDPRFHLKPEEGTLTVDKGVAKAGAEATAAVKLAPKPPYHLATDYPIKLTLEAPAGVKLAKTELTAGGRNKAQGDATTLTEQALAFAIKATADKAGAYEIKGVFKFGVCEKDSCHPKKQPITITVAAN